MRPFTLLVCFIGLAAAATIEDTLSDPKPRPSGGPITVTATISGASAATLVYIINYGSPQQLPMESTSGDEYSATIPAAEVPPGTLVRWAVEAGGARDPPNESGWTRKWYGTIVEDTTDKSSLPVVEFYCPDERQPFVDNKDTPPTCNVFINGEFFDNIRVRRRGQSSKLWPKPKIKLEAGDEQGRVFRIQDDYPRVKEFNLNSMWYEPGENTFMRETLTWNAFREMGVDNIVAYQVQVRFNGQYYGKFSLHDDWTTRGLRENGYSTDPEGPRLKAVSGDGFSGLRWDVSADQIPYYYNITGTDSQAYRNEFVQFTRGINGGGNIPRSLFLFDKVNLPKVINHLAAQTLVLHQDRCSKNFIMYYEPATDFWTMLPWDVDSAFAIDRGLGGTPVQDWCTLSCEQFTSPLFCDRNHPQDVDAADPDGAYLLAARQGPSGTAPTPPAAAVQAAGRRLKQTSLMDLILGDGDDANEGGGGSSGGSSSSASRAPTTSQGADEDLTRTSPPSFPESSFNYLVDAILAVPRTKEMYMRRLRTLMDQFIASGRLQGLVTSEYQKVRNEAKRDQAKWNSPWDVDRGYEQLITEQLPIRKSQLYDTYGPGGENAMIPEAQPSKASLSVGDVSSGRGGFVEIVNDNEFAVDVSNWKLSGGGVNFQFVPGTVIPASDSVYVAGDVAGFKSRQGGQGLFVVGPLSGNIPRSGDGITISAAF